MIDDGLGFQLVPWRPALEQKLGQQVPGTLTPGGGSTGASSASADSACTQLHAFHFRRRERRLCTDGYAVDASLEPQRR